MRMLRLDGRRWVWQDLVIFDGQDGEGVGEVLENGTNSVIGPYMTVPQPILQASEAQFILVIISLNRKSPMSAAMDVNHFIYSLS